MKRDKELLFPGNGGRDCPGRGEKGECLCDACDFLLCCTEKNWQEACRTCREAGCPRKKK